ncbi:lipase family protein [Trinickia acidisoli]|uniref:lipase family protein n=1 Tax=Trinickia acidisoli TaxID=2767482 RepID=UPI001A8C5827|nr:hypothetical protein [Trinickia acidisoli]
MSQPRTSATVNDLIAASVATYGGSDAPTMGKQWLEVSLSKIVKRDPSLSSAMTKCGFYGQVYVNQQTGEVIIANRGTQNMTNLATDAGVAVGMVGDAQAIANEFARRGLQVAQTILSDAGVKMSALYTTGHSLGGAEAEGQAAMLSTANDPSTGPLVPADVHITTLSIDAPGIGDLAHKGDQSRYTSYNFSSQGDVVHKAGGEQLAGTVQVSLPIGPPIVETEGLMVAGVATAVELPFVGLPMLAYGTDKALEAHRSTLVLRNVTGTALGGMKVTELGTSGSDLLKAFEIRSTKAEPVAARVQPNTDAANDRHAAVAGGSLPHIWGLDANGNVDPVALKGDTNVAYAEQWLDANGYQPKVPMQYKNA